MFGDVRSSSSMGVPVKISMLLVGQSKIQKFLSQQPSATMVAILTEIHKTKYLAPTPDENWYLCFQSLIYCSFRKRANVRTLNRLYCEILAHYSNKLVLQYLGLP